MNFGDIIKIKPSRQGLKIPVPEKGNGPTFRKPLKFLSEQGQEVTLDSYWQRRINSGEAIVVQPQSKTFKSKKSE